MDLANGVVDLIRGCDADSHGLAGMYFQQSAWCVFVSNISFSLCHLHRLFSVMYFPSSLISFSPSAFQFNLFVCSYSSTIKCTFLTIFIVVSVRSHSSFCYLPLISFPFTHFFPLSLISFSLSLISFPFLSFLCSLSLSFLFSCPPPGPHALTLFKIFLLVESKNFRPLNSFIVSLSCCDAVGAVQFFAIRPHLRKIAWHLASVTLADALTNRRGGKCKCLKVRSWSKRCICKLLMIILSITITYEPPNNGFHIHYFRHSVFPCSPIELSQCTI